MREREKKKTVIIIIINDKPWYVTHQNFGVLPLSDTSKVENNAPPISFLKQSGKLMGANSPNNPSSSHVHADVPIFATYELGQDLLKPATYKYVLCSMMFNEAIQNPIVFAECWPANSSGSQVAPPKCQCPDSSCHQSPNFTGRKFGYAKSIKKCDIEIQIPDKFMLGILCHEKNLRLWPMNPWIPGKSSAQPSPCRVDTRVLSISNQFK